jgi:1-acyl-sn-glycerol-3-phosphate acyltransferase
MATNNKKKKKKWIKFRHKVLRNILYGTLGVYTRLKYRIKIEKFKEQEKRPYLLLLNHQTPFDQFFVGISFRGPVYYLATEDIFSKGWVSSIINYVIAPIPIKKQTTDIKAIMNCVRVAKEGGTICIAPEGNRTYSGRTEYMSPSIAQLARMLKMPIVTYRIEGGYGMQPRWSDVVRKGKMRCYASRVISPEEYSVMTDEELFAIISGELYIDEAVADAEFHHKKLAEYMERAVYICPECGLSTFESHKDIVECQKCHRKIRYLPNKTLQGVGFDFPFEFVAQWYDYQKEFINALDVTTLTEQPLYLERVSMAEVIPCKKKVPLKKDAEMALYGDRVEIRDAGDVMLIPFNTAMAFTVLGRNKLNIYFDGKIYQIKGDKRFNSLKYVHIFHRYKNISKGDADNDFLGL